jgi:hypothetical protein
MIIDGGGRENLIAVTVWGMAVVLGHTRQLYLLWQSLAMWILYVIGRQRVGDSAHLSRDKALSHACFYQPCMQVKRLFKKELALDTWLVVDLLAAVEISVCVNDLYINCGSVACISLVYMLYLPCTTKDLMQHAPFTRIACTLLLLSFVYLSS